MKSFFKKLAFVMALAMVVSLAAPAAAQAAGSLVLAVKVDGVNVAVTEPVTLALDETVDFNFLGAEPGWQNLVKESEGWKSSDTAVATVDGDGVVTPVAAGTTEITYGLKGYETAKATVTVKAAEVVTPDEPADEPEVTEPEFDYTQVDLKKVTLEFGQDVSKVVEKDVELYRIFSSRNGDIEAYWPIDVFSVDKDNNTITLSTFTNLGDGAKYRVKIPSLNIEEDFETIIPELEDITWIELDYGSAGDKDTPKGTDEEAYVVDVETNAGGPVYLSYKIWAGDMDVTSIFNNQIQLEYVMLEPNPNDDANTELLQEVVFNNQASDGYITFTKKMTVVISANATYETAEGEVMPIDCGQVVITPEEFPEFGYDSIVAWTIWNGTGKKEDIAWYTLETPYEKLPTIPAGEKNYRVILKLQDTRENVYVTDPAAATTGVTAISASLLAGQTWFKYFSTNTDTFLVDESGYNYALPYITTYTGAEKAVIYVELHQPQEESNVTFVDNVYAMTFKIGPAKKLNHLDVTLAENCTNTVSADALVGNDNFLTTTFLVTPKHQYNDKITLTNPTVEITCNDEDGLIFEEGTGWNDGVYAVKLNGYKLFAATGKTSLKYTVKINGVTKDFTLYINKPNWRDFDAEFLKTNGEEGYRSGDAVTVGHKYDILIDLDTYGFKKVIAKDAGTINLSHSNKTGTHTDYKAVANVKMNKTSLNLQVGSFVVENNVAVDGEWHILTDKDWATTTGLYERGDRLVALVDASGKFVEPKANGLYKITVDAAKTGFDVALSAYKAGSDQIVEYAADGEYKLVVYTVTWVSDTTKGFKYVTSDSAKIDVNDNRKEVKLVDRVSDSTVYNLTSVDDTATLINILVNSFKFNLGTSEWKLKEDEHVDTVIADIKAYTNGGYVIFESVTFKVPVDGSTSLGWKLNDDEEPVAVSSEDYYEVTATPINMSVKLGVTE